MRLMVNRSLLCTLAMLITAPLCTAEDAAKDAAKKKDKVPHGVTRAFTLPSTITLTDEQKTKLADVKKEFEPKLVDVHKKKAAVLTAEQKTAKAEAGKAAKAAGKTGKERHADIAAAVKLTDEQKKKQEEINKEAKTLTDQIKEKIGAFLTAEQKAQLKEKKKKKETATT